MNTAQGGLSGAEARARMAVHGPNALPPPPPRPAWKRLLSQFRSPLVYILLFALALDVAIWLLEGRASFPVESVAIAIILLVNAGLGVWQERKAVVALARLESLAAPVVRALRDGVWRQIPAAELVPGDRIRVEAGDRIPADGTFAGADLGVDESVLTGESLPVDKTDGAALSAASVVTRGAGFMDVTATGARSSLGRLAAMIGRVEQMETPLERRIRVFGNQVAVWVVAIAVVLVVGGVAFAGTGSLGHMFLFAVAMAVAAVPEGLPTVMTLTLALGVERMAKRRAVVRKLIAVETLGSVTVIATDKTGTLTENRIRLGDIDGPDHAAVIRSMVLASDSDGEVGDPIDVALVRHAREAGVDVDELRASHPVTSSRPFDASHRFSRVTTTGGAGRTSHLKGAPEVLLARADLAQADRDAWTRLAETHAAAGHRVLGVATADGEREDALLFLGLLLLWDPPRPEVTAALASAQSAGVRVVMVTGDHPATALAVARACGMPHRRVLTGDDLDRMPDEALAAALPGIDVFARVRPEHKLRLVEHLQSAGEVVAMTGDGVNDAPALKRADVGVAMGQRGSDVAREVADLVLLDDNFATIVAAIEEGRGVFENIRKFIRFLFSTNFSELVVVGVGAMLSALIGLRDATGGLLLPLTAVQVLWINLVTDGFPALALALDRNPGVMQRPPTPRLAPLLDGPSRRFVLVSGTTKALVALALLWLVPETGGSLEAARSVAFHFLCIGQLLFAYPARHTWLRPLANRSLHVAVVLGVVVQVVAGSMPATTTALGAVALPPVLWVLVMASALLSWALAEAVTRALWRNRSM